MTDKESCAANFADLLGMRVLDAGEGSARVAMRLDDRHDNWIGRPHGGALGALADRAIAAAAATLPGNPAAIQFQLNFLAAGHQGDEIVATAGPVSVSRRIAVFGFEIRDPANKLLAQGQATALCQTEN